MTFNITETRTSEQTFSQTPIFISNLEKELAFIDARITDSPGVAVYQKGTYEHTIASYMGWGYTFTNWDFAKNTLFDKKSLEKYLNENLSENIDIDTLTEQEIRQKIALIGKKALSSPDKIPHTASRFFKIIDMRQIESSGVTTYEKNSVASFIASLSKKIYTFSTWPLAKDVLFNKKSLQDFLSGNLNESIDIDLLSDLEVQRKVFEVVSRGNSFHSKTKKIWQMDQEKSKVKESSTPQKWKTWKANLKRVRAELLPFRLTDIIKGFLKSGKSIPNHICAQFLSQEKSFKLDEFKQKDYATQKELLLTWEKERVKELLHNSKLRASLECLSAVRWVHGTNSATLAMLPLSDMRLIATGELMSIYGIVPMSGEITTAGLLSNSVNQQVLSAESLRDIKRSWEIYAANSAFAFNSEIFANYKEEIPNHLRILSENNPVSRQWSESLIFFMRMKQWLPLEFAETIPQYQQKIEELLTSKTTSLPLFETKVLKALSYPIEDLKKAYEENDQNVLAELTEAFGNHTPESYSVEWHRDNPDSSDRIRIIAMYKNYPRLNGDNDFRHFLGQIFGWKLNGLLLQENGEKRPFGKEAGDLQEALQTISENRIRVYERCKQKSLDQLKLALDYTHNPAILHENARQLIIEPFPLLFASTKNQPILEESECELLVSSGVRLGDEIDIIFVPDNKKELMIAWLETHNLKGKVRVEGESMLQQAFYSKIPLYHAFYQVSGSKPCLDLNEYKKQAEMIRNSSLSVQDARIILLSTISALFYAERGEVIDPAILQEDHKNRDLSSIKYIETALYWDKISTSDSLFVQKDLSDDSVLLSLTQEVLSFIALTENREIKEFLQTSENLYQDLLRVFLYAQKTTGKMILMWGYLTPALRALSIIKGNSGLSATLESAIEKQCQNHS